MTTIIVIDDQFVSRRILAKLASIGSDVEIAAFSDPIDALTYAEQKTPDLVITDYKMGSMDGDEFIRRLRDIRPCPQVPAVVVTAFQDVADETSRVNIRQFQAYLEFIEELSIADKDAAEAQIEMVTQMMQSINSQLVMTLSSFERANSDLQNIMEITQVAAVFLDREMKVRRFTPASQIVYSMTEVDVGRRISEMETDLVYRDLESDFGKVAETRDV